MSITINGELETKLREGAEAGESTVEAYLERIVRDHAIWERQLEALAIEGIESGEAFEPGPGFWEQQHEWLDQTLKSTARDDRRIPSPAERSS